MGGRDQSQVKIEIKKFEKMKSIPIDVPKSHNDDIYWTQGKSSHDLDSAKQDTSHESGLHRQQSALDLNNAIWNNE